MGSEDVLQQLSVFYVVLYLPEYRGVSAAFSILPPHRVTSKLGDERKLNFLLLGW